MAEPGRGTDFGRSVNPISTRGKIMPPTLLLAPAIPADLLCMNRSELRESTTMFLIPLCRQTMESKSFCSLIYILPTLGDYVQEAQGLLQGIGKKPVNSGLGTGFSQTG